MLLTKLTKVSGETSRIILGNVRLHSMKYKKKYRHFAWWTFDGVANTPPTADSIWEDKAGQGLKNEIKDEVLNNGLKKYGIVNANNIFYNLTYPKIYEHECKNKEGNVFKTKNMVTYGIDTGIFTGRSPKDKWIVKNINSDSNNNIWWGDVNKSISPKIFDDLYKKSIDHFNKIDNIYIFDGYCGASETSKKKVRFIHELAWQHHFVSNMFIKPENKLNMTNFNPDFTIINACSIVNNDWKKHGLNSDVAIAFNIEKKVAVILGTWYGGENKKGIFSLMNYWLPLKGIMSMHCSANVSKDGNSALFFGLSGTGKTTLSADPNRYLIGDDEHGWDNNGIFNLEGGCYAKTIDLSEYNEPDIYKAIRKNALLENVFQNKDGSPDYYDISKTQNGRVSYPIHHIPNWYKPQISSHPKHIIFLTCDAYGILPPISKLSKGQAMYHFLSGYTAKLSGTERGIHEPQAVFSACFGEAFLTLHPTVYADLLKTKIEIHDCKVFLVNTGWVGGGVGIGERISIKHTRSCIDAILNDNIKDDYETDDIFNFKIPKEIKGVPSNFLNPKNIWKDEKQFLIESKKLSNMFITNYDKYKEDKYTDYSMYGPKIS